MAAGSKWRKELVAHGSENGVRELLLEVYSDVHNCALALEVCVDGAETTYYQSW